MGDRSGYVIHSCVVVHTCTNEFSINRQSKNYKLKLFSKISKQCSMQVWVPAQLDQLCNLQDCKWEHFLDTKNFSTPVEKHWNIPCQTNYQLKQPCSQDSIFRSFLSYDINLSMLLHCFQVNEVDNQTIPIPPYLSSSY